MKWNSNNYRFSYLNETFLDIVSEYMSLKTNSRNCNPSIKFKAVKNDYMQSRGCQILCCCFLTYKKTISTKPKLYPHTRELQFVCLI